MSVVDPTTSDFLEDTLDLYHPISLENTYLHSQQSLTYTNYLNTYIHIETNLRLHKCRHIQGARDKFDSFTRENKKCLVTTTFSRLKIN